MFESVNALAASSSGGAAEDENELAEKERRVEAMARELKRRRQNDDDDENGVENAFSRARITSAGSSPKRERSASPNSTVRQAAQQKLITIKNLVRKQDSIDVFEQKESTLDALKSVRTFAY